MPEYNYGDMLAASITPQVPAQGPITNVPAIPNNTGTNAPAGPSNAGANMQLGWPDALVGLSKFIAATKRPRQSAPSPQSFAGIGQPAAQGSVGAGQRARTIAPAGSLGQFL